MSRVTVTPVERAATRCGPLTAQQRKAIKALTECDMTPATLAAASGGAESGVGRTVGSLIEKGVCEKYRTGGHVVYRLARTWR